MPDCLPHDVIIDIYARSAMHFVCQWLLSSVEFFLDVASPAVGRPAQSGKDLPFIMQLFQLEGKFKESTVWSFSEPTGSPHTTRNPQY